MTTRMLRTRRMILKDMGKAGAAVVVFGLAACSREPSSNATPTDDPATTTTSAAGITTTTAADVSTSTTRATAGSGFQRVDLGFVSAYILFRAGEAAVVDTGVSSSEDAVEAALNEIGLGWDSVGHVIVTHEHPDHQGSLPAILEQTDAPWYAHTDEIDAINASDGIGVSDGDSVFDLEMIHTPGHTVGHISVLDPVAGVLVAGDALNGTDGNGVTGANPQFTPDMDLANASVAKLATFEYEVALFGHGEPLLEGASDAVATLSESL